MSLGGQPLVTGLGGDAQEVQVHGVRRHVTLTRDDTTFLFDANGEPNKSRGSGDSRIDSSGLRSPAIFFEPAFRQG